MQLDLPRAHGHVEITVAKVCSVNCAPHCPQVKFREAYGESAPRFLAYDDYVRALSTVPPEANVVFGGFAEPFMHPRALDMMYHAKAKGHRIKVFTTLVGLLPRDVPRFAALKPDYFCPHFPDNHGTAKIPETATWRETFDLVMRTMPGVHSYSRMDDAFVSNERAGNCDTAAPLHLKGPLYCTKLRHPELVMLPSCDLAACCQDWTLRHVVGNLLRESWDEVIHGERFRAFVRAAHRFDSDTLCRSCLFAAPMLSFRGVAVGLKRILDTPTVRRAVGDVVR